MKSVSTKFRLLNILLMLTVMLGGIAVAPAPAHAQDGETRTLLPLMRMGEPAEELTIVFEEASDLQAATSCYGGAGRIPSRAIPASSYSGWSPFLYTTNRCRDINIRLDSAVALYAQIEFFPTWGRPYKTNLRYAGDKSWRVIAWNVKDGTKFRVRLYNPTHFTRYSSGKLAF